MKVSNYKLYCLLMIISAFFSRGCQDSREGRNRLQLPNEISGDVKSALLKKSVYEWTQEEKVIGFRNIDRLWNTRLIEASDQPLPLPRLHNPDLLKVQFIYGDKSYSLQDFIIHNHILGLLVIKDGNIVLENYMQGNTSESKWVSFSIAKSIVSLLVGAAVKDGLIADLNDPITNYLPQLKGSEYEEVSILQAMQMASGVKWNEDYNDPKSDIRKFIGIYGLPGMLDYLKDLPRAAPPGEKFNYNTAETRLVGAVLRAAIGQNLSPYLSSKIWKPFGMESDANWWLLSRDGGESGGCCISATLRDYGRIGLFAISEHNNASGDRSVLPTGWMPETTMPSPSASYYGALWWLGNSPDWAGSYRATGVFGQMIWINPAENLVVVTHSAWPEALGKGKDNYFLRAFAFATAVTKFFKDSNQ